LIPGLTTDAVAHLVAEKLLIISGGRFRLAKKD
jgi:hypothetical protein